MRFHRFPAGLLALALLAGCSAAQPASTPSPESTSTLEDSPPPETTPPPESAAPLAEYERCYLEELGATLLLPSSWTGHYVIEPISPDIPLSEGFRLAQADYLFGEWGVQDDGTEGPIPDPSGYHVTLAFFYVEDAEEYGVDPYASGTTGDTSRYLWLGERDGSSYLLWFPTSFSSGDSVDTEAKYALYQQLDADLRAYPVDASAYLLFDTP